jgi:hypothetical protein
MQAEATFSQHEKGLDESILSNDYSNRHIISFVTMPAKERVFIGRTACELERRCRIESSAPCRDLEMVFLVRLAGSQLAHYLSGKPDRDRTLNPITTEKLLWLKGFNLLFRPSVCSASALWE